MKFIAECGLNHNGNLDLTYELIRQASWAGADVVKFQLGWRAGSGEMNEIDNDRLKNMIDYCNFMDVEPMFSIFTREAFEMLKPYNLKTIKIASRTVIDEPNLVKDILKEDAQFIISLGMWEGEGLPFGAADNIDYLWCVSKYPCLATDLKGLPENFADTHFSGYSDHTIGIESALLAISRGARLIEKHFTLDKSDTTIRDHALSVTPDEFSSLVKHGKELFKLINLGI